MYRLIILTCLLSFCLSSCMPIFFTAAATSTLAIAKDRSFGETVDDLKILSKIYAEFIKYDFRKIYTKIKVKVTRGKVLLIGMLDTQEQIVKVLDIVWNINGVEEVVNELFLDKRSNYFDIAQYTKDSLITAQIKGKIFSMRSIKFVNYTVVTFRDVVFIFGIARSKNELEEVTSIASKIKGVIKVVSHVVVRN